MRKSISKSVKITVIERAFNLCEYCLLHESQSYIGFEIDHIISLKHGGTNEINNLCWSCAFCNQFKGSDLGTILLPNQQIIRFFNPRTDKWTDHFEFSGSIILPKSKIGEATEKILKLNQVDRILEREALQSAGWFPHELTKKHILI